MTKNEVLVNATTYIYLKNIEQEVDTEDVWFHLYSIQERAKRMHGGRY